MMETHRIDMSVNVKNNTEPGVSSATKKLTGFDKVVAKTHTKLRALNSQKVQLVLSALDRASHVIGKVSSSARSLAGRSYRLTVSILDKATAPIRSIMRFATGIGGAILGATTATAALGIPMSLAADYEQTQIAFETMLKSKAKADKFLSEATQFANKTPFEFTDLINSSKLLLAFGFSADEVLPKLEIIGDTASGLGAGAEGIDRITRALGQMQAKGRPQAEELLQLQEMGVPAAQILQEELGLTAAQVAEIGKQGLNSGKVIDALLRGMNKRFGGMMTNQSKTAKGMISTIKDTLYNGLLRPWGQGLWDGIKPGMTKVIDWLDTNQDTLARWGEAWRKAGGNISTYVMDKVNKLKATIGSMTNSQEWKDATTFSEKMKIAWNTIIAQPFDEWWESSGKAWLAAKAESIGKGLGSGLSSGILALLGIDVKGAADEGHNIGASFAEGFIAGFDGPKVAEAIKKALKGILSDAGTVAPGGKPSSSTGWISAAVVAWASLKIGKLFKTGGTGVKWLADLFKGGSGGTAAPVSGSTGSTSNTVNKFADYGMKFGSGSGVAASKAGFLSKLKPFFGKVFDKIFGGAAGMVSEWAIDDAWNKSFGSAEGKETMARAESELKSWWSGKKTKITEWATRFEKNALEFIVKHLGGIMPNFSGYVGPSKPTIVSKWFGGSNAGFSGGGGGHYSEHAYGGIMNKPHLGLVAENGPEGIIPLSPSKRNRGISLWKQAGAMLGVSAYEDGGMPVFSGGSGKGVSIKIDVKAEPNITIESGSDDTKILSVMKAAIRDMADDIGGEIAERLSLVFGNMPVKGVVK